LRKNPPNPEFTGFHSIAGRRDLRRQGLKHAPTLFPNRRGRSVAQRGKNEIGALSRIRRRQSRKARHASIGQGSNLLAQGSIPSALSIGSESRAAWRGWILEYGTPCAVTTDPQRLALITRGRRGADRAPQSGAAAKRLFDANAPHPPRQKKKQIFFHRRIGGEPRRAPEAAAPPIVLHLLPRHHRINCPTDGPGKAAAAQGVPLTARLRLGSPSTTINPKKTIYGTPFFIDARPALSRRKPVDARSPPDDDLAGTRLRHP